MNVSRLLAVAPLSLVIGFVQACSDPPSPPAQGAVTLRIEPASGQVCQHTNGYIAAPAAQTTSVYGLLLGCDLAQMCKPDQYVVVDRDRDTNITCSVSQVGDNFSVAIQMVANSEPSIQFGVTGTIGPQGGMVNISETNSVAGGGGSDPACTVSIIPNRGVVAKGKIWAQFDCGMFRDPNNLGDTGCHVQGAFLFENCSS